MSMTGVAAVCALIFAAFQPQANAAGYPNRILDALMRFHPGWVTRSITTHDQWGGNGDGSGEGIGFEGDYRVLFHGKGEGRILRIWMTCEEEHQARDYQELWIVVDGVTVYKGSVLDYFRGKGSFKSPLVMAWDESSGGFLSYAPFGYAHDAKILFKGNPHYYQVTYREGAGASAGPTPEETARFLSENWVSTLPAFATGSTVSAAQPLVLAQGQGTVLKLAIKADPSKLVGLRVKVGSQEAVPATFFFGYGLGGAKLEESFHNALFSVDATGGVLASRLPIPLERDETVTLESDSAEPVAVDLSVEMGAPHAGVRLATQYRDQRGPGIETTMPFFENHRATQFVSLVEEISDGPAGSRSYLEGDEMIRTDGLKYPFQLGTGTEDYFNGGWYFLGTHANPLSGQPRFAVLDPEDEWKHARFEHALYRHHVLDPVVGRTGLRFGMEAGETGSFTPIRYRTLGLAYEFRDFRATGASVRAAQPGAAVVSALDAERNQQPFSFDLDHIAKGSKAPELEFSCPSSRSNGALFTREYDAAVRNQFARVYVKQADGARRYAGVLFESYSNAHRRFAEDALWIDLEEGDCQGGTIRLQLDVDGSESEWNQGETSLRFFDTGEHHPRITQGEPRKIFDSATLPGGPFYVNDHTFVRDDAGLWHMFGIFNHEPFNGNRELEFVHASSVDGDLLGGLQYRGTVLRYEPSQGETHVWAPHVVSDGQGGYVMAYQSGGADNDVARISLARSTDLVSWQRFASPAFTDICVARDPMLMRSGALWVLYYTRCRDTDKRVNGVAYRVSSDLVTWSEPSMALTLKSSANLFNSGYTESPFVFERDGWFYLSFTSYPVEWNATFVYRSRSPFHFGGAETARLVAHAGEWIAPNGDYDHDELLLSTAGAGQGGVSVTPITIQ